MNYILYVVDTETTGLELENDIIELSLCRLNDGVQKTWKLKPLSPHTITQGALRVNGHKLEDLLHQTKFGRDTYRNPSEVIVEIENWIMEDGVPAEQRVLIAQNICFDKNMLAQLWKNCNSSETFPFGRRVMDTMIMAFMMDYAQGQMEETYNLGTLIKKYGIKNDKAHTAEADAKATAELFNEQIKFLASKLRK